MPKDVNRHPKQPVDPRHRDAVMGDHQKACPGGVGNVADEAAEPVDIGVVERGVDLVELANRGG
jgi:hypothetical protein